MLNKMMQKAIEFLDCATVFFWALLIGYVWLFYHLYVTESGTIKVGLVIGFIYVFIAFYYFRENYLAFYREERQAARKKEKALLEKSEETPHLPKSAGMPDKRTVSRKNIWQISGRRGLVVQMLEWILTAVAVQVVIVFGFKFTLDSHSLAGNIYTHPGKYGELYSTMYQLRTSHDRRVVVLNEGRDNTDKIKAASEEFDDIVITEMSRYMQKEDKKETGAAVTSAGTTTTASRAEQEKTIEMALYDIPFRIALAFGFLGTLIYTLKETVLRLYTLDLYPKTFINNLIRFIFAPALSLVVAYFLMNSWPSYAAPLLFLSIGFFPQLALSFIEEKAREILKLKKEEKQEMPLRMIQGMTDYMVYRFRELGIDDVQNLAYADINYLRVNLGYSDSQICDFIAQAMLLLYLKEDFPALKNFGIRDIISFKAAIKENNYLLIAEKLKVLPEKLKVVLDLLENVRDIKHRVRILEELID